MIGWKAWCALVVGTGMGAGGVVAVKQMTPRKAASGPVASKPAAGKSSPARPAASPAPALQECPVASVEALPMLTLPEVSAPDGLAVEQGAANRLDGPSGGAWQPLLELQPLMPVPSPPAGAVPEPATWAMLVAGFGMVGLSLRRTRLA